MQNFHITEVHTTVIFRGCTTITSSKNTSSLTSLELLSGWQQQCGCSGGSSLALAAVAWRQRQRDNGMGAAAQQRQQWWQRQIGGGSSGLMVAQRQGPHNNNISQKYSGIGYYKVKRLRGEQLDGGSSGSLAAAAAA
jgi:hypothetical protein